MTAKTLLAACLILLALPAAANDLPIFDSDNFAGAFHAPSMQQSLGLSAAFYQESHEALQRYWGKEREHLGKVSVAIFDLVAGYLLPLPLSEVWLHEEFHRAVMANRGIDSFNDVYRFRVAPDAIAVSHVRDEELIRLKRDHPADLVRLHASGAEGEHALILQLEKERFFHGSEAWNVPLYLTAKVNSSFYILSGTAGASEDLAIDAEREEGTDLQRRDFTGHDFTAWVYDLFRPNEPYQARGAHPSGAGIRRYRRPSDLTGEERAYLKREGLRSLVNFLDPNLAGFDGLTFGATRLNATASHYLTSFGSTIDLNAFIRRPNAALSVVVHAYRNHERTYPGLDVEWIGRRITPRIAVWQQPREQRFFTDEGEVGGLVSVRLQHRRAFVIVEAKSAGWVAGNPHLDANLALRAGFAVR